jgi:2-amino-4-hydroxy-6-hydroxymethyldihydropteridine diphosphokinase
MTQFDTDHQSLKLNKVAIAVGSNINPHENIEKALRELEIKFGKVKKSTMIETEPVGFLDQPNFVNGAFLLTTALSIQELKKELKGIEEKLGRIRTENKYGPRTIDLDIIVFNGEIVDKDFYTRDFVKNPVLELWPDLRF